MRKWVDHKMKCPGISLAVSDFRLLPSPSPILAITSVSLHVVVNGSSSSSRLYILLGQFSRQEHLALSQPAFPVSVSAFH